MPMEEPVTSSAALPVIKWPGGKRALVPELLEHSPKRFGTYFEPFFGGGALFFALQPATAVLADLNRELIGCYECVKDSPDELIRALRRLKNTEDEYYRIRGSKPRKEVTRAARLLYLTRLSFNGIHRVNLRGEFNVPYGWKTHLDSMDDEALVAASDALQGVTLRSGDFEVTTADAKKGDFLYFDPPYTVAHSNNGFVKYNEHIFSWADQVRLAKHARALSAKGCHVMVSNADHTTITKLYGKAKRVVLHRYSKIAASSEHRRRITESLFVFDGD
jgi:DNA adenine methylase